jgi:signal transduction histidine kinase/phage shock protein PspC (stress-responsive transcriptional regulator)
VWQIPRLNADERVITGTAAGLAREVGIDAVYLRVSFVVLTLAGGWGLVLYLAAWFVMARTTLSGEPYVPIAKGVTPRVRLVAFAMIATGLVVLSSAYGLSLLGALVWPAVFGGAAGALGLVRSRLDRLRPLGDLQNRTIGARIAVGLTLLFAGVISASFVSLSFWQAIGGIVVAALVLLGAGIVFAPIISTLANDLLAERRRRIRSEERADMAAHLHDSVLQTLTLIQKRSHDASVVSLARRQERELRTWLFDDKAMNPNLGFRAGLEAAMAGVEDMYQLPLEVVVVGDCPTDDDVAALLQSTREAASNAANHSGAARVDVFAEVGHEAIEVFVRDVGMGFDPLMIEADRAGVRDSVIGRMERHGGTAVVHSSLGEGTEVELRMPRRNATNPDEVETF